MLVLLLSNIIKTDLVSLIDLSKIIAKHHSMTLEKSSRWITEEAIKSRLLIYDLSGKPVPYNFDEGADIVLDVVNHRWWEATDKESEIIGGDWAEHRLMANDVSISKTDAEKCFSIIISELEEPKCLEVVIRTDLIDIVSLSKAIAKYRNMTNAEACDWVTTELNKVEALAFYDISGYSLPERLSEKRAEFAACECFNQNWWRSPEIEDLAVPSFGGISAKEIAINKTAAEKYCLIPREVLEEILEETHLLFIEPQKVISKILPETNIIEQENNESSGSSVQNAISALMSTYTVEVQDKPISESERNSMLKLIIGMAIDAYGYAPDKTRNAATGDNSNSISSKLSTHGIKIDTDTVRKYLTEAKKLI